MSKKKTLTVVEEPEPNEVPESSPAAELEQQIADERETTGIGAIEEVLAQVDKVEGQFAVKRIDPLSGKQLHLERLSVSILRDFGQDPNEFLKARYGGGQYNLIFYVPQQGGGWRQYTMRRFEIDATIPPGEFFRAQRASQAEAPGQASETLLSKLADKIKTEGGGGNTELLLGLMQLQAKQSADMLQVMMKSSADTMTAITSMVAALKGDKGGGGHNLLEALAVFDKLKGKDTAVDPVRLLELAHKWFRDHDRDGEEEPAWIKALAAFLPMVMPGQAGQPVQPVPIQQARPALPDARAQTAPAFRSSPAMASVPGGPVIDAGPGVAPAANGQPAADSQSTIANSQGPVNQSPRPPVRQLLQQIYPVIIGKIQEGTTPEDVYDWLSNPVMAGVFTDEQWDELVELFRLPTWETELFGDAKLIEPHKAWFEKIRALFLEENAEG